MERSNTLVDCRYEKYFHAGNTANNVNPRSATILRGYSYRGMNYQFPTPNSQLLLDFFDLVRCFAFWRFDRDAVANFFAHKSRAYRGFVADFTL